MISSRQHQWAIPVPGPLPLNGYGYRTSIRSPAIGNVFAASHRFLGSGVVAKFSTQQSYHGQASQVTWNGYRLTDPDAFVSFLQGPVRSRLTDESFLESLKEDMRSLRTTGMDSDVLETFIGQAPPILDWEIGEALAECFLTDEPEWRACWPSNPQRDRRAPRASLPGADLVGFKTAHGDVIFLFGEVKTSADKDIPPSVMNGRHHGLAYQIETKASPLSLEHWTLFKWLWNRCEDPENFTFFKRAMRRYLASKGSDLLLMGMLMRDTSPDERDLRAKAEGLGTQIKAPTQVQFLALYSPKLISEWPVLVGNGTP